VDLLAYKNGYVSHLSIITKKFRLFPINDLWRTIGYKQNNSEVDVSINQVRQSVVAVKGVAGRERLVTLPE
jgi:hypothetical protein